MADTVRIQVITSEPTEVGLFNDAIYYKDLAEYQAKLADGSHDAQKAVRVASYVNLVKFPSPAPVVTKADLIAAKTELQAQIATLDVEIGKK